MSAEQRETWCSPPFPPERPGLSVYQQYTRLYNTDVFLIVSTRGENGVRIFVVWSPHAQKPGRSLYRLAVRHWVCRVRRRGSRSGLSRLFDEARPVRQHNRDINDANAEEVLDARAPSIDQGRSIDAQRPLEPVTHRRSRTSSSRSATRLIGRHYNRSRFSGVQPKKDIKKRHKRSRKQLRRERSVAEKTGIMAPIERETVCLTICRCTRAIATFWRGSIPCSTGC